MRIRATVLAVFVVGAFVLSARAQTNTAGQPPATRDGQVLLPTPGGAVSDLTGAPRQELWNRAELPPAIRDRLREFDRQREAYLKHQQELTRRLQGASEADRQRIRDQIRDNRQAWADKARQFREQARERLQELRDQLPHHREVMEAAREKAQEQARDAAQRARERRGTD